MDREKRLGLRWLSVIIFLASLILIILVPLFTDLSETTYGIIISVYSLGGAAIIIYIMLRPYLKRRKHTKNMSTGERYEVEPVISNQKIYHEKITMKVFIFAYIVAAVVIGVTAYFVPNTESASYGLVIVLLILIIVGYFFRALDVRCDNKNLSFYFGPFGKDVPLHQIENIEVTDVRPLKDFMGWGHRIGPDGSIGYIAAGGKGVKIDLKDGKAYVITIKHPEKLRNHVEKMKEKYY